MERFDIYLVKLDPVRGKEIAKTRPAVIISPDEMNGTISTVIIAPMTTSLRHWPSRIDITFHNKKGQIALDQIRAIDKSRLTKKLGAAPQKTGAQILQTLQEIFA